MILDRLKYQLGYPEAAKDMIASKSVLTAVEQYSMGSERPLSEYLKMVGLDMTTKEISLGHWCKDGMVSTFLVSDFAYSLTYLKYFSSLFNSFFVVPLSHLLVLNNLIIFTSEIIIFKNRQLPF